MNFIIIIIFDKCFCLTKTQCTVDVRQMHSSVCNYLNKHAD